MTQTYVEFHSLIHNPMHYFIGGGNNMSLAGVPFDPSKYPWHTPSADAGSNTFVWAGNGSVRISTSTLSEVPVYVDDNIRATQKEAGAKYNMSVETTGPASDSPKYLNITSILYVGTNTIQITILNQWMYTISYSYNPYTHELLQTYWIIV